MRNVAVVIGTVVALASCGGAQPSRWEPRPPATGPKTVCHCDGVERGPTPSEASSESDPRAVTMVCEGKVSNCHPARGNSRDLD